MFNVVKLSEVQKANRIDAEYFQKKYEKLVLKIKNKNFKKLGEIIFVKRGVEPGSNAYQDQGKPFIRVSNLSKFEINQNNQKYLSEYLYNNLKKDYQPQINEILLIKDATPGIACVVKNKIEGVISGGILRLQLKSKLEPEYLALVINSLVGQMQVERDAGGSIIKHWKPNQVNNILIPILPKSTQQKIASLVQRSHEARKESKELLEHAKRKVEGLINKND